MGPIRTDRHADNCILTRLQFHSKTPLVPLCLSSELLSQVRTCRNIRSTYRKADTVSSVVLLPPPSEGDFLEIISAWLPASGVHYEYT